MYVYESEQHYGPATFAVTVLTCAVLFPVIAFPVSVQMPATTKKGIYLTIIKKIVLTSQISWKGFENPYNSIDHTLPTMFLILLKKMENLYYCGYNLHSLITTYFSFSLQKLLKCSESQKQRSLIDIKMKLI